MNVEQELRTYLSVLWRYKWLIIACAVIASLVALEISLQLTPIYTGTATLRVASAPGGSSDYIYLSTLTRLTNTLVEIANSDATLDEVARQLGLEERPKVETEIVPETELISITASHPDPVRARDIANSLAALLVEQNSQFYGSKTAGAREVLDSQLKQAKVDLDNAMAEYDSALRCSDSAAALPAMEPPLTCPNAETLARILSVRQQIYTNLLQNYESAMTNEQLRANNITITELAAIPDRPTSPKVALNTALGLAAGLALGVILAFLFEAIDDTVRGIEDVQAMTNLPIMGQIPTKKRTIVSLIREAFSKSVRLWPVPAFHHLGARLLLSEARLKSTSFLITSPEPGTGKSTIVSNLAMSLAEAGHRVVLVDMDFHRPRQHIIFRLPNEKGVSDYLRGTIQLDAALQEVQSPNLRVITAGSGPQGISEWLKPDPIGALLGRLDKDADYVLVDAPTFLSVADPSLIASQAHAVILVVAQRKTRRGHLRLTLQQLAELNVRVAGVVVNRVPHSRVYSYYTKQSASKMSKPAEKAHSVPVEETRHPVEH